MANSFDVNLQIGSSIGFTKVGGSMSGPTPIQTTTLTLDGDTALPSGYNTGTRILSIAALSDFIAAPGTTSTRQTVYLTNNGNSAMTVTEILHSLKEGITPKFYFQPENIISSSTITITVLPGSTSTFELAYQLADSGSFNSYFIIVSNNSSGYYKVNTRQLGQPTYDFRLIPEYFNTTTTLTGKSDVASYNLIPIFNTVEQPSVAVPISIATTGSTAWSLFSTGTNTFSFKFNPNVIGNVNGTYVSTSTISANNSVHTVTNTATVFIDSITNKHIGSWLSPASYDNSIIGISYNMENSIRYLTIGVGMGGEDSPIYSEGGSTNLNMINLGLGANSNNYPYWSKVYRIPFSGDAATYYSKPYVDKTTTATDYSSYFGEFNSAGSMFVVEDDGYGSIKVGLNNLIEFTTSTVTTSTWTTLNNLTRAFHYYSNVDINGRIAPLATEYASPLTFDTNTTQLFTGFDYNTRDQIATTGTSIVAIPG